MKGTFRLRGAACKGVAFRQGVQGHTLQFARPHLNISTEVLGDIVVSDGGSDYKLLGAFDSGTNLMMSLASTNFGKRSENPIKEPDDHHDQRSNSAVYVLA